MIFAVCVLPSVARSLMTGAAVLMCATHFLFFLVRVAVTLRHLPLTKRWTTTVRLGVRARPATVVAMVQELIRADTRVMDTVADVPLFVGGSVASTFWPLTVPVKTTENFCFPAVRIRAMHLPRPLVIVAVHAWAPLIDTTALPSASPPDERARRSWDTDTFTGTSWPITNWLTAGVATTKTCSPGVYAVPERCADPGA